MENDNYRKNNKVYNKRIIFLSSLLILSSKYQNMFHVDVNNVRIKVGISLTV